MKKFILSTFDLSYLVRFLLLFLVIYYANYCYIGITTPGHYYSSFLDHQLNYFNWMKVCILHLSGAVGWIAGIHTEVVGYDVLKIVNGAKVDMGWGCIGIGVMSFWIAFIFAQQQQLKKKIWWTIGGLVAISLINSVRILLVLVGNEKKWEFFQKVDNHTFFNIAAYILVFILIYLYDRHSKTEEPVIMYSAS
jgi:exosortase/archaeosortase family protein